MSKELSFLKENKLFNLLLSALPLIFIGIMQYFLYTAYIPWIFWEIVLLAVLSGLCVIAFAVWLGVTLFKTPTVKNVLIFTVIFTTIVCFFYFGASAIDLAVKNNNLSAFILGAGSSDLILIVCFVFGWALSAQKKGFKCALIATTALLCALIIVLSVFVSFMPKQDVMLSTVKDFTIMDTLPDGGNKKVKVILINGQSNASGVSRVSCLSYADAERYKSGFDDIYINYFCDNGNNSSHGAFVHAGLNMGYADGFFGPELGLADRLSEKTDEQIFIIKYTWGGTILDTQWFAPRAEGTEGPLYRAFINFTTGCMDYLRSKNYDASIGAMCWMQGESDSIDEGWTDRYYRNTVEFVSSLRKDLAPYADKDGIYYIDAGISDSQLWERYQRVNDAKKRFASDPNNKAVYIDTIAAGLDFRKEPDDKPDLAHYDAASEIKLGYRFADAVLARYNLLVP